MTFVPTIPKLILPIINRARFYRQISETGNIQTSVGQVARAPVALGTLCDMDRQTHTDK